MKIVVLIPAFNEEDNIKRVIEAVPRHIINSNQVLVAVVDDGSLDSTTEASFKAGADYVFRHSSNFGVGQAFKTGIKEALKVGADIIVNIDADGQFDPAEIPRLVLPIVQNEADVVLGSRFMRKNPKQIPGLKRIGNQIISTLLSIFLGKELSDTQCGFRAISSKAARNLELSGVFTYTQEMIIDLAFRGASIVEVPVKARYFSKRQSRVVKRISTYTLKVIGIIASTFYRHFRLHIVSLLSIFFIIFFILFRLVSP